MVPSTRAIRRGRRRQELCLRDCLDVHLLVERVHWGCPVVVRQVIDALVEVFIALVKEILLSSALSVVSRRDEEWEVVLQVAERVENLDKLLAANFFF